MLPTLIKDSVLRIPIDLLPEEMYHHFEVDNKSAAYDKKAPPKLSFLTRVGDEFWVPRNYPIRNLFPGIEIKDETVIGKQIELPQLNIGFYGFQQTAINHVVWNETGDQILCSPCGSGKTTMGLGIAKRFSVKTAILVQTDQLLQQWRERIEKFFGIEPGIVKGKIRNVKDITLVMVPTVAGKEPMDYPEFEDVGLVIADECHAMGALEWNKSLFPFKAAKRVGLTATPDRSDGLGVIMDYALGKSQYRVAHEDLVSAGIVLVPEILTAYVNNREYIRYKWMAPEKDDPFYKEIDLIKTQGAIAKHKERNEILVDAIVKAYQNDRKIIVAIQRIAHIEILEKLIRKQLGDKTLKFGVLRGGMKPTEYEENFQHRIIFGIISLMKQGLDVPELDTLVLASPVSAEGMITQMLGRISRTAAGKKTPLVIDIADTGNIMLVKMGSKRKRIYGELGCRFRN